VKMCIVCLLLSLGGGSLDSHEKARKIEVFLGSSARRLPEFWMRMMPISSGLWKSFSLDYFEDGGNLMLRNVGNLITIQNGVMC